MTMYTNQDSTRDGYPQFEASIQARFDKAIAGGKQLFTTTAREELYELYLTNLPETKEGTRQHYSCHGCRQFFTRYGGLVTIDEDGNQRSVMFDLANTPAFFATAVAAMQQAVTNARVDGVFIPDARVLGTPKTGEWTHVHVRLPEGMANRNVLRTAFQVSAAKREDYNVLSRVSSHHSLETADQAIALLKSETVYRGERYIPAAEWFRNILIKLGNLSNSKARQNYLWLMASQAPVGFIPSNSSNLGQTLSDIVEYGLVEAGVKLAERLKPTTFMRSQTPPSANALREAEKYFEKLKEAGIVSEDSLKRRYAKLEEVPMNLWQAKQVVIPKQESASGVFGHITPKDKKPAAAQELNLPSKVMTFEKFNRTVLPTADKIEVLIDNPQRFMAMIMAAVEEAPNMLQWENLFSWYYHTGVDGDIKQRVENAGGRYANNVMRVSLSWESYTDLDIHCITPSREHIYYGAKRSRCGGELDVDANGGRAQTEKPVENIRWARTPLNGRYRFYVHNYQERSSGQNPFKVELEANGKVWTYNGISGSTGWQVDVFEFDYKNGEVSHIRHAAITSNDSWTAQENTFVKVNGITTSPNTWGENPKPHAGGSHVFFLLDGLKDEAEGQGRGFFNEMLKPELREIRRVLEAYSATAIIEGADEATACGLGFNKDGEWNVTLKVTTGSTTQLIKIDRWD